MVYLGRVAVFGVLLALGLAWAPSEVGAQKKKKKDAKDLGNPATPADYKSIQNRKDLTGTIVGVTGDLVTLKVDYPHMETNPKYKPPKTAAGNQQAQMMRTYQDLMLQQQRAMNARTPQELQRAFQKFNQDMNRFQQQYGQQYAKMMQQYNKALQQSAKNTDNKNNTTDPFIVVTTSKDFELEMTDKIVVRKTFLPLEFDDTGKAKVYTEKEKTELRGDDKSKPGYTAKLEDILPGMEAKLHLKAPPKKTKDKDEPKADADAVPEVERPTITMVVLTKDTTAPTITGDDGKGKKKNKK